MPETIPYLKPLVIVDVETTGGSFENNRLIEIGIVRIENGREVKRYQSLINPSQPVPPFVQRLTGISDRDLVTAPPFDEIALDVEVILKDALFIGHNVRFDYDFIRHEFRRLGKRFAAPTLCSARFSRALFPEYKRHNLGEIVERHGLSLESHHRALDDAGAVWHFLVYCAKEKGNDFFLQVFEKLAHGRPPKSLIPSEKFENIPETPGVYIFRDADGKAIFVGRSSNLREKILGHFYGDFDGPREVEIASQAIDLEWLSTPGELSAFFMEGEKIAQFQPRFARKLTKPSALVCAVKEIGAQGYWHIHLQQEDKVQEKKEILGYYRGFREAKQALTALAKKYNLCPQFLDLEKGLPAIQEKPALYNERLSKAFQEGGVESWPYASAVILDERYQDSQEGQAFIVQNWLLIARIFYTPDDRRVEKLSDGFDWDKFKILKRCLREPSRVRAISSADMLELLEEAESKSN